MVAIETTGLTKYFEGRTVVKNVALHVPEACIYGFVGPNGAGKTTVMRMLLGLIAADKGTVRIFGNNIAGDRRKALAGVGAVIESPALYGHLTGRANLRLTCTLLKLPYTEADRVLELVDLASVANQKVANYSLGMKQRLAIGRTLLGAPRLLILDEPTNGLDPDGIIAMRAFIGELPTRIKGTVFLSSHLLSEVEQIADYVGLMQMGQLTIQDKVSSLIGTGTNYAIEVDRPDQAAMILRGAGFNAGVVEGGLLLSCNGLCDARQEASNANRLLIETGCSVYSMSLRPKSLEDIYRGALSRGGTEHRSAA
jgi:lantibiotic transport system ATP-binding protein